jgi:hypothetical protein
MMGQVIVTGPAVATAPPIVVHAAAAKSPAAASFNPLPMDHGAH